MTDVNDTTVMALRRLNDGVSRPVSTMEREVCGRAADLLEQVFAVLKQIEGEMRAGLGSSYGETREQVRRALAALSNDGITVRAATVPSEGRVRDALRLLIEEITDVEAREGIDPVEWQEQITALAQSQREELAETPSCSPDNHAALKEDHELLLADFREWATHKPDCRGGDGERCACGFLNVWSAWATPSQSSG